MISVDLQDIGGTHPQHDGLQTWVEDLNETRFRVCAKEATTADQVFSNFTLHYIVSAKTTESVATCSDWTGGGY